ncbi:hypothetical protein [uncultured Schumannella sp.]|uniref:hypothetical protein n=1 Tax=uncultured Schumannella sp. TaxID=1195956 RepID=UPI0025FCDF83|nr:hypothetical protein [uncultured Schumannella sp.]
MSSRLGDLANAALVADHAHDRRSAHAAHYAEGFATRWISVVAAAEVIGFSIPAVAGTLVAAFAATPSIALAALVAAGVAEGALLGTGQILGFGRRARIRAGRWIGATAAGAAIAWAIGMSLSITGVFDEAPGPLTIVVLVLGGLALVATIPTLQWLFALRDRPGSARWIPISMAAWTAGLMWTLAPSIFIDETTPPVVLLAAYLGAGTMMALTSAILTAPCARSLAERAPTVSRPTRS